MPQTRRLSFCRTGQLGPLIRALDSASLGDGSVRKCDVDRAELLDPYALLSLGTYVALFEAAAEALGQADLGLRLGKELKVAEMGPLGLMFTSAPTLGEGLESFPRSIGTDRKSAG